MVDKSASETGLSSALTWPNLSTVKLMMSGLTVEVASVSGQTRITNAEAPAPGISENANLASKVEDARAVAQKAEQFRTTCVNGQRMPYPILENSGMKRYSNGIDVKLQMQIEGLSANQIKLLASIYAGLAKRLRNKKVADSLAKWKERDDHIWN